MLDLYSGLGGASEAFVQAGWKVIRVEKNPDLAYVPHTLTLDCHDWADWAADLPQIDLVWASPPCTEFSNGYNAPKIRASRAGEDYDACMKSVMAALDIVDLVKPKYWILENVVGSIEFIEPLIGKHRQKVGPCILWGNFPHTIMPQGWIPKSKVAMTTAQARSMIPFELSFALLEACRQQTDLRDWC